MQKNDIIMYASIAGGAYLLYWYLNNYGPTGAVHNSAGALTGNASYWATWFNPATTPTPTTAVGGTAPAVVTPALMTSLIAQIQAGGVNATNLQTFITSSLASGALSTAQAAQLQSAYNTWAASQIQQAQVNNSPAITPTPVSSYAGARAALIQLSGGNPGTLLNADQWSYYINQPATNPATGQQIWGGANITPQQFVQAFPNITATDRGPTMTVDQYLNTLQATNVGALLGLSGVGDIVRVGTAPSVPSSMSFGGAFAGMMGKKGWA